jgi:outer membrane protein assembly factor BamD (BamD/ComL family)
MLKPQKKKLSKKELKKDPLLDSVLKAQTYYEENKTNLLYGGIGLIIVILLIVWVVALNKETEMEAMSLLGKAQIEFDNMNYTSARGFLERLRENYSSTDSEAQGTFLLANLHYNQDNYTQAKDLYGEFIDAYSGSEILLASGYAGLAACEEIDKNYIKAAEYYEEAFSLVDDFPQGAEYLYLAGLNYIAADNQKEAIASFNKLIELFPDSPRKFDAETKLILASTK